MATGSFVVKVLFRIVKKGNGDVELIGCYLRLFCADLGESSFEISMDCALEHTSWLKVLFPDFLELFMVWCCCFVCELETNNRI